MNAKQNGSVAASKAKCALLVTLKMHRIIAMFSLNCLVHMKLFSFFGELTLICVIIFVRCLQAVPESVCHIMLDSIFLLKPLQLTINVLFIQACTDRYTTKRD